MANSNPVNLDKAWLENFLNEDIDTFIEEIKKVMSDGLTGGEVVLALSNLLPEGEIEKGALTSTQRPLAIGGMVGDSETNGKHLVTSVVKMINDVVAVFEEQETLFKSIDENLRTSITDLFETQGENLAKIDGEKFLDIFSDVDDSLSGGGGKDDD